MIDDARGRAAYLAYRAGAELARAVPPAVGGVVAVVGVGLPYRSAVLVATLCGVAAGAVANHVAAQRAAEPELRQGGEAVR